MNEERVDKDLPKKNESQRECGDGNRKWPSQEMVGLCESRPEIKVYLSEGDAIDPNFVEQWHSGNTVSGSSR